MRIISTPNLCERLTTVAADIAKRAEDIDAARLNHRDTLRRHVEQLERLKADIEAKLPRVQKKASRPRRQRKAEEKVETEAA